MNGIVEKTRKKNEISIGEAADVIGIPRMLIDIRHGKEYWVKPQKRNLRSWVMDFSLFWCMTLYFLNNHLVL